MKEREEKEKKKKKKKKKELKREKSKQTDKHTYSDFRQRGTDIQTDRLTDKHKNRITALRSYREKKR